jgi:hypothetical protein
MKTLIITVGTRQVGWHCQDDIVRCLGADGGQNVPTHVKELYENELGIDRGHYSDLQGDRTFPWSVFDLGYRLYQRCKGTTFEPVELLLDRIIIESLLNQEPEQKLTHVILWGTQQPEETVSWQHRRLDTAWLAELMAGKLQHTYPMLQVKVFRPILSAVDSRGIQKILEAEILPFALNTRLPEDQEFTLCLENKGATPAIAEGLSICAAAMVRDCQVMNVAPIEPRPLYQKIDDQTQAACAAKDYRPINLSEYFWPLERSRILSAWERGDFREAQLWLLTHRNRHKPLYELAESLTLTTNWQIEDALKELKNWIDRKNVKNKIPKDVYEEWRSHITLLCLAGNKTTPYSKFLKIWEATFLIWLELERQNISPAFIYFSQTLERILFLRYQSEDWITQGYINLPEDKQSWGTNYKATFGELRFAWQKMHQLDDQASILQQFKHINELRNSAVHKGEPLTLKRLGENLFPELSSLDAKNVYQAMEAVLRTVCAADWQIPKQPMLRSLYEWGLEQLSSA